MRIHDHPVLGPLPSGRQVRFLFNGRSMVAREGEPIAAALLAAGVWEFHRSRRTEEPRGPFCAIGRCTDCVMVVNGAPNVRTCVTPVEEGMVVEVQAGRGETKHATS